MTHSNDDTRDAIQVAAEDGANAKRLGVPVEHNPHEAGTDEYDAWESEWESADHTPLP